MPDSLMYDEEMYVVLEPELEEQFLTAADLLAKLESVLIACQEELPPDLQQRSTPHEQAQYLINTTCEFNLGPDQFLQWYAVRLEKPESTKH